MKPIGVRTAARLGDIYGSSTVHSRRLAKCCPDTQKQTPFHYWLGYREVSIDNNTATETQTLKLGQGGRKPGREPKENDQKPRKPRETQGPCPDLRGFCIKALTVCNKFQRKTLCNWVVYLSELGVNPLDIWTDQRWSCS